ncbi:ATP-binding cassette domain-containing protein [Maricaulis sp. CAU 1757]
MSTGARPVLEVREVFKTFPDGTEAVQGVSLDLQSRDVLALVGESGCGKTTLLKLMNRLEDLSGGSILYEGRDIAGLDPVRLRRRLGWVMQGDGLFPHLSVGENVAIVPRLLGWSKSDIAARVDEMLSLVRLEPGEYRDRSPGDLSGGQRQRVGFARALAGKPDVLLMDEPFSALDPVTRDALQQDFKALQAELGFAAILVTHDMAEALLLADRIAVMLAGRIVQEDTPARLLAEPAVAYVAGLLDTPRRQARAIADLTR